MNKDISDSKINDNYKVMEVVYYQDQYYTFMVESEVFGAGLFQLVPQFLPLITCDKLGNSLCFIFFIHEIEIRFL